MRGQTYSLVIRKPEYFIESIKEDKVIIYNGLNMRKVTKQIEASLKTIYEIDMEITPHMIYNLIRTDNKSCNKLITFFCNVIVERDETTPREIF